MRRRAALYEDRRRRARLRWEVAPLQRKTLLVLEGGFWYGWTLGGGGSGGGLRIEGAMERVSTSDTHTHTYTHLHRHFEILRRKARRRLHGIDKPSLYLQEYASTFRCSIGSPAALGHLRYALWNVGDPSQAQ